MPESKLSRRLHAAFLLVKEGRRVADIGTDHALLPIALVKSGKTPHAIASDVNKLPLEKAKENIEREGLSDSIETFLADGAVGLEARAEEFIIAGMGGELIAEIISASPFLKRHDIHLVLQPMTKIPVVRRFLWENGFDIEREVYLEDMGHFYTVISAYYTGNNYIYTPIESELGQEKFRKDASRESLEAVAGEIKLKLYDLEKKIKGKNLGGINSDADRSIRDSLKKILCEVERNINEAL